jgi:hypothetical protein
MSYLNSYKQDTLVSGTNIKTINGSSILGSGNLVVTGSGASWGSITGTLSSQTDLQTALNAKQDDITLTTTGSSGAATFISNTLNVPNYTLTGLGGVPTTRALTINGSTQDLSADRTFTISDPEGWTTIVKSANQDVTNNGATDDTEFQFSIVAGGHYMIELIIAYSGNNTTGDFSFGLLATTGTLRGRVTYQSITTANAATNATSASVSGAAFLLGVATADLDVVENVKALITFHCSANATYKIQHGQASPAAGRTTRLWKGSILKYKRLD